MYPSSVQSKVTSSFQMIDNQPLDKKDATNLAVKLADAVTTSEAPLLSSNDSKSLMEKERDNETQEIAINTQPKTPIKRRAFAIEVKSMIAPTEAYEQMGERTPASFDRETPVSIVASTYGNSINWLVMGEMNKDGQNFRDEIYECASKAHNEVDRGCGKYYRGTNSVHVKRLHSDAFESMYNHNHYPLGGKQGSDFDAVTFPEDVTPDEFKAHLLAFSRADSEMHGGKPRFLDEQTASKLADEFAKNYLNEEFMVCDGTRQYTEDDIKELKENEHLEQPCKFEGGKSNTRGIGSEKADDRQPPEYDRNDYKYVLDFRQKGKDHLKAVAEAKAQLDKTQ